MLHNRDNNDHIPARMHPWYVAQSHKGDKYDSMGGAVISHDMEPVLESLCRDHSMYVTNQWMTV